MIVLSVVAGLLAILATIGLYIIIRRSDGGEPTDEEEEARQEEEQIEEEELMAEEQRVQEEQTPPPDLDYYEDDVGQLHAVNPVRLPPAAAPMRLSSGSYPRRRPGVAMGSAALAARTANLDERPPPPTTMVVSLATAQAPVPTETVLPPSFRLTPSSSSARAILSLAPTTDT